ncbi:hypothetical protein ACB098_04G053300 [Castanea mollissima]
MRPSKNFSAPDEELQTRRHGWKLIGEKFTVQNCNRKLIEAKFFSKGHDTSASVSGPIMSKDTVEYRSPRDADGYSVASKARLAVYKVCSKNSGCFDPIFSLPLTLLLRTALM